MALYIVGGRGRALPLDQAKARAEAIHARSGAIVAIEESKPAHRMRMNPATLAALRAALDSKFPPEVREAYRERYRAAGLTAERWRWDMLHASGYDTAPLYRERDRGGEGLNDSHVSTALRALLGEL